MADALACRMGSERAGGGKVLLLPRSISGPRYRTGMGFEERDMAVWTPGIMG